MKKKLHSYFLLFTIVLTLFSVKVFAQDVNLYRTATDNAAVASFVYPSGNTITYYDAAGASASPSTSTSSLCGLAARRVQTPNFMLNVKSTSISKIILTGTSSGTTSYRNVSTLSVNGTLLTKGTDYTFSTTVYGATCGQIVISGLNIPQDATNGINIAIGISGAQDGSGTTLSNLNLSEIILTPISTSPLDFLSLAGKADALGKTVDLNWSTTNEVNTKNFEIQKRTDDDSFVTIGSIASKNTAGVHAYSFTDQRASSGTAYYRVLQFDNDGSSKSSSVIAVTSKAATKLSVYPNPAEQTLNVNHPLSSNKANFSVLSLDGKIMLKKAVAANSTSFMLDVSSLASGAYMVILEDQNQKSSIKFIKK